MLHDDDEGDTDLTQSSRSRYSAPLFSSQNLSSDTESDSDIRLASSASWRRSTIRHPDDDAAPRSSSSMRPVMSSSSSSNTVDNTSPTKLSLFSLRPDHAAAMTFLGASPSTIAASMFSNRSSSSGAPSTNVTLGASITDRFFKRSDPVSRTLHIPTPSFFSVSSPPLASSLAPASSLPSISVQSSLHHASQASLLTTPSLVTLTAPAPSSSSSLSFDPRTFFRSSAAFTAPSSSPSSSFPSSSALLSQLLNEPTLSMNEIASANVTNSNRPLAPTPSMLAAGNRNSSINRNGMSGINRGAGFAPTELYRTTLDPLGITNDVINNLHQVDMHREPAKQRQELVVSLLYYRPLFRYLID
jgi:hypothetical protein